MSSQRGREVRRTGLQIVGVLPVSVARRTMAGLAIVGEETLAFGLRQAQALLPRLLAKDLLQRVSRSGLICFPAGP